MCSVGGACSISQARLSRATPGDNTAWTSAQRASRVVLPELCDAAGLGTWPS